MSVSYAMILRQELNQPMILRSSFGLPYFKNGNIAADARTTVKLETVFFNLNKILGYRLAPFVFTEFSFLTPMGEALNKTNGYSAFGGGIRTRNENLIFGTMEMKAFYFPRTVADMKGFRFELSTKLRFKFNSSFVKRPDFIVTN